MSTGTPQPSQDSLNKWFREVTAMPATIKFLNDAGGDAVSLSSAEEQAMMIRDVDRWKELVQIAKITPQG